MNKKFDCSYAQDAKSNSHRSCGGDRVVSMVLGNHPVAGRSTNLPVGQGCGLGLFGHFSLIYRFSLLSPSLWETGWVTCDFTSFSTVFQSYQNDRRMIMKGCVQWNPVCGREDFASSGA